ncbi:hypothetical protein [Actinacidiphila oryziradicis]|uniref:Uncharacterized protein n=1 Tax=Actinacidiphila oryziradicis TaxID=2571141 RepID=A0A4U0RLF4_9ACTN|nr:hypothetical protein [Actinacidiphila oryziradicis]TJZ95872.1 hypothetical protein FCI23_51630 [Actinacidiphila oryziradicis]
MIQLRCQPARCFCFQCNTDTRLAHLGRERAVATLSGPGSALGAGSGELVRPQSVQFIDDRLLFDGG